MVVATNPRCPNGCLLAKTGNRHRVLEGAGRDRCGEWILLPRKITAAEEFQSFQGICEGLTYDDFQARYPKQFAERDKDKYHYRYPSGEVRRLPIVLPFILRVV